MGGVSSLARRCEQARLEAEATDAEEPADQAEGPQAGRSLSPGLYLRVGAGAEQENITRAQEEPDKQQTYLGLPEVTEKESWSPSALVWVIRPDSGE